jgi:hypothetical protein
MCQNPDWKEVLGICELTIPVLLRSHWVNSYPTLANTVVQGPVITVASATDYFHDHFSSFSLSYSCSDTPVTSCWLLASQGHLTGILFLVHQVIYPTTVLLFLSADHPKIYCGQKLSSGNRHSYIYIIPPDLVFLKSHFIRFLERWLIL